MPYGLQWRAVAYAGRDVILVAMAKKAEVAPP